jgi:hypothetical protein
MDGSHRRLHVVWTGAGAAGGVWYTQLNPEGTAFAPEREVRGPGVGRPGGAAIAVSHDYLYVFWHAPGPQDQADGPRQVWLARSNDNGKTFGPPRAISPPGVAVWGAGGLCALHLIVHSPTVLYRGGAAPNQRDLQLLYFDVRTTAKDWKGHGFLNVVLHPWPADASPKAAAALILDDLSHLVAVWDAAGQVYLSRAGHPNLGFGPPVSPPGAGGSRQRPAVAQEAGFTALVWLEDGGRGRAQKVCWQFFDRKDQPATERGEASRLPGRRVTGQPVGPEGAPAGSHAVVVPYQRQFLIIY